MVRGMVFWWWLTMRRWRFSDTISWRSSSTRSEVEVPVAIFAVRNKIKGSRTWVLTDSGVPLKYSFPTSKVIRTINVPLVQKTTSRQTYPFTGDCRMFAKLSSSWPFTTIVSWELIFHIIWKVILSLQPYLPHNMEGKVYFQACCKHSAISCKVILN